MTIVPSATCGSLSEKRGVGASSRKPNESLKSETIMNVSNLGSETVRSYRQALRVNEVRRVNSTGERGRRTSLMYLKKKDVGRGLVEEGSGEST